MSALHGASRRSLDAAPMRRRAYVFVLSGRIESEGPAERFFTGEVKLKRMLRPDVPPRTFKCTSKCSSKCTSKAGLRAAGLGHVSGDRGLAI